MAIVFILAPPAAGVYIAPDGADIEFWDELKHAYSAGIIHGKRDENTWQVGVGLKMVSLDVDEVGPKNEHQHLKSILKVHATYPIGNLNLNAGLDGYCFMVHDSLKSGSEAAHFTNPYTATLCMNFMSKSSNDAQCHDGKIGETVCFDCEDPDTLKVSYENFAMRMGEDSNGMVSYNMFVEFVPRISNISMV